MSAENKAVVRRVLEGLNHRNLDDAASVLAPDYVWHGPGPDVHGPAGWKQLAAMYLSAFPDLVMTIDDQIAEGDRVATRYTARGTHRGELAGVAASGRYVTVPCLSIERVVDGKVVESFEVFDQLGMFATIGTLPALSTAV
jgi:predicted ester cyclase